MTDERTPEAPRDERLLSAGIRPPRASAEEIAAAIESGQAIVCYSHCMWCGRRTPHEWCHECSESIMAGKRARTWKQGTGMDPETCEYDDEHCDVVIRCNAYLSEIR